MSLHLKDTSRKQESTGDGPLAVIDGDIIVRACAAAADGRCYKVKGTEEIFKYISEARAYCKENDVPEDNIKLSYEPDPLSWACHSIDEMLLSILNELHTDNYIVYLSEGKTVRHTIYPEYKANRKKTRIPHHFKDCKEHIKVKWGAEVWAGMEADDAIHMKVKQNPQSIICSIDKDFDIIQGWHYNWNTNKTYFVSGSEALRNFYRQMITGDTADNIIGLSRKKPKKRTWKTEPIETMQFQDEMEWYVYCGYVDRYGEEKAVEQMELNGRLLWLCTDITDVWEIHI